MSGHDCHGCEGIQPITPRVIHNRAGLDAVDYRVGTHAGFIETMLARIAQWRMPNAASEPIGQRQSGSCKPQSGQVALPEPTRVLSDLSARETDDPSIAVLDSWALIADVLSFYQERFMNEAFLRTATERRSIQQLANLVGYKLRPGLSSSVYLAFTVEDTVQNVVIPHGTQAKSTPTPESQATSQTFETSQEFLARPLWNEILPRMTMPHDLSNPRAVERLYLQGLGLQLQPSDRIGIQFSSDDETVVRKLEWAEEFPERQLTIAHLQPIGSDGEKLIRAIEILIEHYLPTEVMDRHFSNPREIDKRIKTILAKARSHSRFGHYAEVDRIISRDLLVDQVLDKGNSSGGSAAEETGSIGEAILAAEKARNGLVAYLEEEDATTPAPATTPAQITAPHGERYANIGSEYKTKHREIHETFSSPSVDADHKNIYKRLIDKGDVGFVEPQLFVPKFQKVIIQPSDSTGFPWNPLAAIDSLVVQPNYKHVGILVSYSSDINDASIVDGAGSELTSSSQSAAPIFLSDDSNAITSEAISDALKKIKITETIAPGILTVEIYGNAGTFDDLTVRDIVRDCIRIGKLTQPISGAGAPKFILAFPFGVLVAEPEVAISLADSFNSVRLDGADFKLRVTVANSDAIFEESGQSRWKLSSDGKVATTAGMVGPASLKQQLNKLTIKPTSGLLLDFEFLDNGNKLIGHATRQLVLFDKKDAAIPLYAMLAKALQNENPVLKEFKDRLTAIKTIADWGAVPLSQLLEVELDHALPGLRQTALDEAYKLSHELAGQPWENQAEKDFAEHLPASIKSRVISPIKALEPPNWPETVAQLESFEDSLTKIVKELNEFSNKVDKKPLEYIAKESVTHLLGGFERHLKIRLIQEGKRAKPAFSFGKSDPVSMMASLKTKLKRPIDTDEDNPNLEDPNQTKKAIDDFISQLIGGLDFSQSEWTSLVGKLEEQLDQFASTSTDPVKTFLEAVLKANDQGSKPIYNQRQVIEMIYAVVDADAKEILRHLLNTIFKLKKDSGRTVGRLKFAAKIEKLKTAVSPGVALDNEDGDVSKFKTATETLTTEVLNPSADLLTPLDKPGITRALRAIREFFAGRTFSSQDQQDAIKHFQKQIEPLTVSRIVNGANEQSIDRWREVDYRLRLGGSTTGSVDLEALFRNGSSSLFNQIQSVLKTEDRAVFFDALRRFRVQEPAARKPIVSVFRSAAQPFGWNAPGTRLTHVVAGPNIPNVPNVTQSVAFPPEYSPRDDNDPSSYLDLDGEFPKTIKDSKVVFQRPGSGNADEVAANISKVSIAAKTQYGISGKATMLQLDRDFWPASTSFVHVQNSRIWCDQQLLSLAEVQLDREEPVTGNLTSRPIADSSFTIELNEIHPELNVGSTIIIEGNQDEPNVDDVGLKKDRQVYQVTKIQHRDHVGLNSHDAENGLRLYGDRARSVLTLNREISVPLLRGTVRVYANVAEATHGGTVNEVLGGGDGRKSFQRFDLKDTPLTRVSDVSTRGARDELEVRVNNVRWGQTNQIATARQNETKYELVTSLAQREALQFGDGQRAARLPTGDENIRATYRVGLGLDGNVDDDRIDQLPSPPYGVKAVRNPIRAAGGANRDSVFQARKRTGLTVATMDRLVSLDDYQNFALTFAGIDKAKARQTGSNINVTIAGTDIEPLVDYASPYKNLLETYGQIGDPEVTVNLHPHDNMLLFVSARVKIRPDHLWQVVESQIRQTMLNRFGYARADFDLNIHSSDVIATIQSMPGVVFVDLDAIVGVVDTGNQGGSSDLLESARTVEKIVVAGNRLCFLTPQIPNMLQLEEIQ